MPAGWLPLLLGMVPDSIVPRAVMLIWLFAAAPIELDWFLAKIPSLPALMSSFAEVMTVMLPVPLLVALMPTGLLAPVVTPVAEWSAVIWVLASSVTFTSPAPVPFMNAKMPNPFAAVMLAKLSTVTLPIALLFR